jgi:dTDP-4-amino-4,6-dideoxygalactose transaminase
MSKMEAEAESFVMPLRQYVSAEFLRWRGRGDPLEREGGARSYQFSRARHAIYHALAALGVGAGDRVLAPAYLCVAAVEAVTALGATVDFHDVRDDCSVDVAVVEGKIQPNTRALICVHYFGFPQRVEALRELCNRRGLLLLEDCAHVLPRVAGGPQLGRVGDVAVFSWPKLLPVEDGATLVVNRGAPALAVRWEREELPETLQTLKDMWDRTMAWTDWSVAKGAYGWLQRSKAVLRQGRLGVVARARDEEDGPWFDLKLANWPMSRASRWILAHTDLEAIRRRRRQHYELLGERIQGIRGVTSLFPRLEEGVCPWVYPLRFEGRPKAHLELRAMGIPAIAWDGVRPAGIFPDEFPRADFLYDNLVMLPVHQSLRRRDLELIAESVARVAGAGQVG